MFPFIRTLGYGAIVGGFMVVFIPGQLLSGQSIPGSLGVWQIVGSLLGLVGAVLTIWSAALFALVGRGTPAPFDPPRTLVTGGPYAVMRNPMAGGVGAILVGMALYYESLRLGGYVVVFFLALHFFIVLYEEPTLRRLFGDEYEAYCRAVGRWVPGLRRSRT